MVNFVAFIGWAPEDTQEIFTLEQLIEKVQSMGFFIACSSSCAAHRARLSAPAVFAGASAQGRGDRQHQQARLVQRSAPARQVHRRTSTHALSSFFLSAFPLRRAEAHHPTQDIDWVTARVRPVLEQALPSSASLPDAYLHQVIRLNKARLPPPPPPSARQRSKAMRARA